MSYTGDMIKMLRETHGLSQEELGRQLGVGRAAINKYEKGVVENIPIKTIEAIATIFNTHPVTILGWDDFEGKSTYEAKVISGVEYLYGTQTVTGLKMFIALSPTGRRKAMEYLDDIFKLYAMSNDI